jgi:hypothetical protein
MTYGGYGGGGGAYDPFGEGPFSTASPANQGPNRPLYQDPSPRGSNTAATLSLVFAFLFAPAGAVLGHVALGQIKQRPQPGRDRAVVGLTLSYVFIMVAVIALVVGTLTVPGSQSPKVAGPSTTPSTMAAPVVTPSVSTTVITPPAPGRPTVAVEDLRVGDCVEVQQTQPDLNYHDDQDVKIFRVGCEVRDGVFRVDSISSPTNTCGGRALINIGRVIFACISPLKS